MITSPVGLQRARSRWLSAGRDPKLFDIAVTVLDCATSNLDVRQILSPPTYSIKNKAGTDADHADVWLVYANGEFMLEYSLREVSADADVTVFA